jgi:hypothetical protein
VRIKGGPELKARLMAVIAAKPEITRAWAEDASDRIAADAPKRTGALERSIEPGEKDGKGVVRGNYYGVILDRGTKSYEIKPKKAGGRLVFNYRGRTIFAKKSQRRKLRRRPFITRGAQDALQASPIMAVVVKAYSRKRGSGRFSRL